MERRKSKKQDPAATKTTLGSRPLGTDGSDHAHRMVVEDKYKQVASAKANFRKIANFQATCFIIRGLWTGLFLYAGEPLLDSVSTTLIFGAGAAWFGMLSLRGSKLLSLRFYILFSVVSVTLIIWPLVNGYTFQRVQSLFNKEKWGSESTRYGLCFVEIGLDVISACTQSVGLWLAIPLLRMIYNK